MKSTLFNPDPIPDVYNTVYSYSPAGNILSLRRKGFVGLDGNDDPIFDEIDKLTYTYHQDIPSKLIKVEDDGGLTHQPRGFFPLVSDYDYDANGNLVEDSGKDLEIDYNLLNLPTYIFNTDTHDEMLFEYAFGGEKLKKVSIIDDTTRTRLYMGGFEFLDDEPEAFHHGEGRIVLSDSLPRFQFKIADHLGNTVVLFEDKDNSGTISTMIPQDPEDAEVVQRNLYYPFGMQLDGTWKTLTDPRADYLYNGKELEEELRLGWLAFGFRYADPAIGRFTGVDPIADQFAWVSPFNYAENRVPNGIDLWGLQYIDTRSSFYLIATGQTWIKTNNFQSGRDAFGLPYMGMAAPVSQVNLSTPNGGSIPLFSRGARDFTNAGNNLGSLYEAAPKTNSGNLDRRYNSTRAYQSTSANAAGVGKVGLSLVALDIAVSIYSNIKGLSDAVESRRQQGLITRTWDDIITALGEGKIDPQFHNLQDLSSMANFIYQGEDTFGNNEELRNTAIYISKYISGNYKGDDELIHPESGLDNYKPGPILSSPVLVNPDENKN